MLRILGRMDDSQRVHLEALKVQLEAAYERMERDRELMTDMEWDHREGQLQDHEAHLREEVELAGAGYLGIDVDPWYREVDVDLTILRRSETITAEADAELAEWETILDPQSVPTTSTPTTQRYDAALAAADKAREEVRSRGFADPGYEDALVRSLDADVALKQATIERIEEIRQTKGEPVLGKDDSEVTRKSGTREEAQARADRIADIQRNLPEDPDILAALKSSAIRGEEQADKIVHTQKDLTVDALHQYHVAQELRVALGIPDSEVQRYDPSKDQGKGR